jgi:hypothetical protein
LNLYLYRVVYTSTKIASVPLTRLQVAVSGCQSLTTHKIVTLWLLAGVCFDLLGRSECGGVRGASVGLHSVMPEESRRPGDQESKRPACHHTSIQQTAYNLPAYSLPACQRTSTGRYYTVRVVQT